jgi:hypothetical protein
MDVIEFGYKKMTPDLSEKQPVIQVTIFIKGKPFPAIGIVDSGADYVTIPLSVAISLGLERKELGPKRKTECACGNGEFYSYLCEGEIEIGCHRFPIKISLVEGEGFVLIGRQGVFDHFHVHFDKNEKKGYLRR